MSEAHLLQRHVFRGENVTIRHVAAHPCSMRCGEVEDTAVAQLVLPMSGVFARHDAPRRHVIANPNHALLFDARQLYRISYPGGIGDEVLVLEFGTTVWSDVLGEEPDAVISRSSLDLQHSLMSPRAQLER